MSCEEQSDDNLVEQLKLDDLVVISNGIKGVICVALLGLVMSLSLLFTL